MRLKRHRKGYKEYSCNQSKNSKEIRFLVLGYIDRLLNFITPASEEFFECLNFALNGIEGFTQAFQAQIEMKCKKKAKDNVGNESDFAQDKEITKLLDKITLHNCRAIIREIKSNPKNQYPAMWEGLCAEYPHIVEPLLLLAQKYCKEELLQCAEYTHNKRFAKLSKYFSCSEETVKLVELIYSIQSIKCVESYFEDSLDILDFQNNSLLCRMLEIKEEYLDKAIEEAQLSSFVDAHNNYRLSDNIMKLLQFDSEEVLDELFYTKLKSDTLPLNKFTLEEEQKDYILRLLASETEKPVHILLYGEPGTGKTCFAKSLAAALKFDAWSISSREDDRDSNRRASLVACRHLMQDKKKAFIVVDEAERLLDTDRHNYDFSKDKAWLNSFLEKPKSKVIWISNEVYSIDQAVRRRFAYSVHFKKLTKEQRMQIWQDIVKKEKVSQYFKKNDIAKLVNNYDVSAASISAAIQQSKELKYRKADFINAVCNYLNSYSILANNGRKKQKAKENDNDNEEESYTLDGVTLEESSKTNLPLFIEKIKKIDAYLKTNDSLPANAGTMLFYGPPGTGKSALAKHIAKEIGRKCIFKRASDILGMYVGESENNIREAFEEAEKDGAILVFDEADSFIFSRENAVRSWETSAVNEFLTSLESFKGICTCTTNHRKSMDSASMRRFAFKIGFTYAKAEQIISLYETILSPLVKEKLSDKFKNQLLASKFLTAGDFAAVRSQFWLYEKDKLSHKEIVEALVKEQSLKLEAVTKKIGF